MKSNIRLELQGNGNLLNVTTESDKIYQGAVATTEYSLTIADGVSTQYAWRPTDLVWIVFERPDGLSGQFSMTRSDNGWVVTTNGWETDVDISQSAVLKISFLMKRYSTLSGGKVSEEKPTQQIDLTIHPSSGYIPQNIELEISELLQEQITQLQLDKVGRYSVSNGMLPFLPPEIVFLPDGNKTPNNIYFDFTHNIIDFDNETYEKTGVLFVQINGGVQSELFITSDKRAFVRNVGENFVPATQTDLNEFTYSKEYLENIFAGFEADIENLQDQIDGGLGDGFVTLSGDQTIMGTKTFLDSPIVPSATANPHAINRADMFDYAYSKEEINNLTTPIGFETEQNFLNWLGGTFTRPDGILPSDLLVGKKIIIQEEGKNNYQVAEVPVVDLSDFKVLVEDNKFAEEIGFKPYETIEADNVQDAVEEVKDEVDLKTQIVRLDNLVIESNEWVEENGEVYFDHMIPEFTNSLEQEIEIVNNNKTQSDLFIAEQITVKAVETIGTEPNLGIRLILNKAPSETITLSVFMSNSTKITFEAGEVVAKNVFYDNTASGLIADNVQDAVDELSGLNLSKTNIYVDSNRADTYVENGSINKPFKTFKSALTHIQSTASITSASLHLATGLYTWGMDNISKNVNVYGNGSTLSITANPQISGTVSFMDLNITSASVMGIYADKEKDILFENCSLHNIVFLRTRPVLTSGPVITLRNSKMTTNTNPTLYVYERSTLSFENSNINTHNIEVVGTLLSKNSDITTYGGVKARQYTDEFNEFNGVLRFSNTSVQSIVPNTIEVAEPLTNEISEFYNVCLKRPDGTLGTIYHNTRQLRLSKFNGDLSGSGQIRPINKDYATTPQTSLEVANKGYVDDELDLKADKTTFTGNDGDIFYINNGEVQKLSKQNDSFLKFKMDGTLQWKDIRSDEQRLMTIVESGDIDANSIYYKDGYRKFYSLNVEEGQTPLRLKDGIVGVGFSNAALVPLFGSVLLNKNITQLSSGVAYDITSTNFINATTTHKYMIISEDFEALHVITDNTSDISSWLRVSNVSKYGSTIRD